MIRQLALLIGGVGAAGVLAAAVALGSRAPAPIAPDELVPVANAVEGGQGRSVDLPTAGPNLPAANPSGDRFDDPIADVQNIYVLPPPAAPVVHPGGGATNAPLPADDPQPTHRPHQPRDGNGDGQTGDDSSGDQAGDDSGSDDQAGEDSGDDSGDQAGEDEHDGDSHDGDDGDDHSDDGVEPGDD